jgi:glycosyltransferase involved in cell wall biosynthesis
MGIRSHVEVIPNGVDLDRFRPTEDDAERIELRKALGIGAKNPVLLSIGAIHPRKGIDLLLEAWVSLARRFPNAQLYLIGMRHDLNAPKLGDFKKRVDELLDASGAADRTHFLGYIDNVEAYLKAADLLVFPSRREGMPNAVLEAMASGLPCVLTPFIGLSPDFGRPDKEYLLVDHDPQAIANGVASVLDDDALQQRLAVNGRRWVQDNMNVEDMLDRYAALYRSIAGK